MRSLLGPESGRADARRLWYFKLQRGRLCVVLCDVFCVKPCSDVEKAVIAGLSGWKLLAISMHAGGLNSLVADFSNG